MANLTEICKVCESILGHAELVPCRICTGFIPRSQLEPGLTPEETHHDMEVLKRFYQAERERRQQLRKNVEEDLKKWRRAQTAEINRRSCLKRPAAATGGRSSKKNWPPAATRGSKETRSRRNGARLKEPRPQEAVCRVSLSPVHLARFDQCLAALAAESTLAPCQAFWLVQCVT